MEQIEPYKAFGIECGNGWRKLISPIINKISEENTKRNDEDKIIICQIKEKFGGLRFYVVNSTDEIKEMINKAEEESFKLCEICGSTKDVGMLNNNGWIKTICKNCFVEMEYEYIKKPFTFKINSINYIKDENNKLIKQ